MNWVLKGMNWVLKGMNWGDAEVSGAGASGVGVSEGVIVSEN